MMIALSLRATRKSVHAKKSGVFGDNSVDLRQRHKRHARCASSQRGGGTNKSLFAAQQFWNSSWANPSWQ
jgi:hypothetical protein